MYIRKNSMPRFTSEPWSPCDMKSYPCVHCVPRVLRVKAVPNDR